MENKIYFLSTPSCTKCPMVKGALQEKNVDVEYINIEEEPDIAIELGVMSVPTVIDNREGHKTTFIGQGNAFAFVQTLG